MINTSTYHDLILAFSQLLKSFKLGSFLVSHSQRANACSKSQNKP